MTFISLGSSSAALARPACQGPNPSFRSGQEKLWPLASVGASPTFTPAAPHLPHVGPLVLPLALRPHQDSGAGGAAGWEAAELPIGLLPTGLLPTEAGSPFRGLLVAGSCPACPTCLPRGRGTVQAQWQRTKARRWVSSPGAGLRSAALSKAEQNDCHEVFPLTGSLENKPKRKRTRVGSPAPYPPGMEGQKYLSALNST